MVEGSACRESRRDPDSVNRDAKWNLNDRHCVSTAQPVVVADGPPAPCQFNHRHGPPQKNTLCANLGAAKEYAL